jgi:hypothetical protein
MSGLLWRWVDRHLARNLPPAQYRTTLGDLMEDHARRRRSHGRVLAALWLVRECRDVSRVYRTGRYPQSSQRFRVPANVQMIPIAVKNAIRLLRRSPWRTAAIIATLSLAIGMGTTMFAVVDALIVRPVPFPNAHELLLGEEIPPKSLILHESPPRRMTE